MSNYVEDKKTLKALENHYGIVFRCAISELLENGVKAMSDDEVIQQTMDAIDREHNEAEQRGEHLIMGREFTKAIVQCEHEIAAVNLMSILTYINYEMEYCAPGEKTRSEMQKDFRAVIGCYADREEDTAYIRDFIYEAGLEQSDMKYYGCDWMYYEEDDYDDDEDDDSPLTLSGNNIEIGI